MSLTKLAPLAWPWPVPGRGATEAGGSVSQPAAAGDDGVSGGVKKARLVGLLSRGEAYGDRAGVEEECELISSVSRVDSLQNERAGSVRERGGSRGARGGAACGGARAGEGADGGRGQPELSGESPGRRVRELARTGIGAHL